MIASLDITDPARACVPFAATIPFFREARTIAFQPGLNILWGPNGCGKTTALLIVARMLHCAQGGRSCVTMTSMQEITGRLPGIKEPGVLLDGIVPVHDGQCVLHCDPNQAIGLVGGMAGFDWDFGAEGIQNAMMKGSAGEVIMRRLTEPLRAIVTGEVPDVEWKAKGPPSIQAFMKGTLPKGPPSILLDEPDRSIAMKIQAGLWQNLATRHCKHSQVIAASHSPFALNLPGAHYIDMVPGYLEECRETAKRFLG